MNDGERTIDSSDINKLSGEQAKNILMLIVDQYNICKNEDEFSINALDVIEKHIVYIEKGNRIVTLEAADFPVRIYNVLKRAGFNYLHEIGNADVEKIYNLIPEMYPLNINWVINVLNYNNIPHKLKDIKRGK
jgi:DNA-directed RNA polymerase alpha subunit